jgi:hypothetical protein
MRIAPKESPRSLSAGLRRHPFASLAAAFIVGAALGTAKSAFGRDLYQAVKRRLT